MKRNNLNNYDLFVGIQTVTHVTLHIPLQMCFAYYSVQQYTEDAKY
jgi:hypothetical protein